jgi:hypothetical protein
VRDPNAQELEGVGVGPGWIRNAELIGLGHGSPLLLLRALSGLQGKMSSVGM